VNVYPFIEAEKQERRNVKRACELLQVSRAAYYAARDGQPSRREQDEAELSEAIKQAHADSKGRYGAPRVHAALHRAGRRHGKKRIARLMRAAKIRGRTPKRWKKTTIPDPAAAARADLVRRDFSVDASRLNARWCGDITYVPTWEGWLYLATVIDIASRRVVGFAMADHLRTELVADALTNAVAARNPDAEVIFHSDRAVNTPAATTPGSPAISPSGSRSGAPVNAGTTPSRKASSPRSRANASTRKRGPPSHPRAARSSTTSHGSTARGCTAHSATRHPTSSKPQPGSRRWRR
jgi:transposase InsO family protein